MSELVHRLRSVSHYCDQLGRDLFDRGMKKRFTEAARYFAEQADVIEEECCRALATPSRLDDLT